MTALEIAAAITAGLVALEGLALYAMVCHMERLRRERDIATAHADEYNHLARIHPIRGQR